MPSLLFIANINAGRSTVSSKITKIVDLFIKSGYRVELHITQSAGDARQRASEAGCFDLVVCSGGDGTVNEVVSGLLTLKKAPPLGIIPAGTTNDFAHTLGIPSNALAAAKIAVDGVPFPCDTGIFEGRPFVYAAAFGLFTNIPYATSQELKNALGGTAYLFEAIRNLSTYHPYTISLEYDGGILEDTFLLGMITNTVSIAGIRKAFDSVAQLDDGKLEISLLKLPAQLSDLQKAINILIGAEHADNKSEFLTLLKTRSVKITSKEPISWTLDGEEGGETHEVTISNNPLSLTVMRPRMP